MSHLPRSPRDRGRDVGKEHPRISKHGRINLFEEGRLSAGAAAQLSGLPNPVFMIKQAGCDVSVFRLTEAEIARDAQTA